MFHLHPGIVSLSTDYPKVVFSFDKNNYSLLIMDKIMQIFDQNQKLIANYNITKESYTGLSRLVEDRFYFLLTNKKTYNVYCFDRKLGQIECSLNSLQDPHFLNNQLIDFSLSKDKFKNLSTITIYDLTKPDGEKKIERYNIQSNSVSFKIDEQKKKVFITSTSGNLELSFDEK